MPNSTNYNLDIFNDTTDFTIKNRRLWRKSYGWADEDAMHLEEVRDILKTQRQGMRPVDNVITLNRCVITFNKKGVPFLQFITPTGQKTQEIYQFTHRGWRALLGEILPKSLRDWGALSRMDETGAKIATMAMNKFLFGNDNQVLMRLSKTRTELVDGNGKHILGNMVRTVQKASAAGYTPVDNLELVTLMLEDDYLQNSQILDVCIEDQGFRLRFACLETDQMKMEIDKQYPMIELRNSEVGLGSILIGGASIRPWCSNGMYNTTKSASIRFSHRGDEDRIVLGVKNRRDDIIASSNEVVKKYNQTLEIEVDDLLEQMNKELQGLAKSRTSYKLTEHEQDLVSAALKDETTHDNSLLAAGVDAITFAAKALPLDRQLTMEQLAFDYMCRSIEKAESNKILIEA